VLKLAAKKARQEMILWRRRGEAALGLVEFTDRQLQRAAGSAPTDEHRERGEGSFYFSNADRSKFVKGVNANYLRTIPLTIKDAEEICEHVFDELGSGKTSLGRCIDWHQDFKSGYRWPVKFYTNIAVTRPDKQADVKVPWELSRSHYYATLGKAYWYTRDEKYAQEFVALLTDWIRQNPSRMTINWCSAMEVAIRLVNLIWGYHFFVDSPHFNQEIKTVFLKSLVAHAQFVAENLEYFGELSDNHYVANIVGLATVGISFPEFRQAKKWKRLGVRGVFDEVINQVHEDGVQFEGSINYHRLVLEMFLSVLILCMKNGIDVPDAAWRRLEKMFEFVLHYLKPDGVAPQIGDTDDGRLQVLSSDKRMHHRYLLAVGAVLFDRSDFKAGAGCFPEEALWLLGPESLEKYHGLKSDVNPLRSKGFPQGGFYFMRNDRLYMAVRCAANGRRGIGNHSHNDPLSFDLFAYDKSFIVDPGTYVYTPEPEWRNRFRSTAYHNTLVVDGEEINTIPEDLFQLRSNASPTVNKWETTDQADFLDGQHNGYERLREAVTHRRQFYFDKVENYWIIRDLITGHGVHSLSWYFHFDAGIDLTIKDDLTVETMCQYGANLVLRAISPRSTSLEIEDGWVSPGYGIKKKAQVARYACRTELPTSIVFILYPYSGEAQFSSISDRLMARAEDCWGTPP
jgi:uncharacterized heparinase superfamily protein